MNIFFWLMLVQKKNTKLVISPVVFHLYGIKGMHYPYKAFEARNPDNLPKIRVFFYSNENERSQEVAAAYAQRGVNAYYVEGGLYAWKPIQGSI